MSHRDARGFTLLEMVVAFVIAALALGVMFKIATDSLQESAISARYEEAVVRAKSHLAMATDGGSLMPGNWSGDDGGGYRWQLDVRPISQATAASNGGSQVPIALYDVSVSITWSEGGHTREVRLDTEQIGQPVNNGCASRPKPQPHRADCHGAISGVERHTDADRPGPTRFV